MRIVGALGRKGVLDSTWIVYTTDHGEMAGSHGLMSKCVLYEPAVRVPLIVRPPGGCAPRVVDSLVEQLDVPATVREIAGAPDVAGSEGQSLLGAGAAVGAPPARDVAVSENWGFAVFETERHKLVVDEDAMAPCQLFDLAEDPAEDEDLLGDPLAAARRRGAHGDARAAVLPHATGAAAREHPHGRPHLVGAVALARSVPRRSDPGSAQPAGVAGRVDPYAALNALRAVSGSPGVDTCTLFWIITPLSLA